MTNEHKVPSLISYSNARNPGGEQQWGSRISGDAVAMMHTKMQLDYQPVPEELELILNTLDGMQDFSFEHVRSSGGIPEFTDKSAEEIVTDYLSLVFKYLVEHLSETVDAFGALRKQVLVDIVVTIPTVGFAWPLSFRISTDLY